MSDQKQDNVVELDELRAKVEERASEEAEQLADPAAEPGGGAGGPDDPRFVRQCFEHNEVGDGLLFASIHNGRYLFNKIQGKWFAWGGHHWVKDTMGTAVDAIEAVALRYQVAAESISPEIAEATEKRNRAREQADACEATGDDEGKKTAEAEAAKYQGRINRLIGERNALHRRVNQLRGKTRAEKCLWWAHHGPARLAIRGDEFDQKPMLLPCQNGVIDLETGRPRDGDPKDLLLRAIPIPYDPSAKAPRWHQFLREIHQEDEEKVAFVRRLLGYCLTGLTVEQLIAVWIGEGANGKGTLFELMHYLLGELAWSINPELILEQKNSRNSAGPSPDIISLYGRRLVLASENDENRRISGASVKRLTGSDMLTGRSPHDKDETNFVPTHKLFLATNDAPVGLTKDFALFRRLIYLEYPLRYVADVPAMQRSDPQNAHLYRQKDPALPDLLRQEAPGILADLVRACLEWQRMGGLCPPPSLLAAAEEQRRKEDHLQRFIEECCRRVPEDEEYKIILGDFYERYIEWYKREVSAKDRYFPSKIMVGKDLVKKGYRKENKGGQTWIHGLEPPPAVLTWSGS